MVNLESSYEHIQVFPKDSEEYRRLQKFVKRLNITADLLSPDKKPVKYTVENVFFDYGQNWRWTTITAYDPNKESILCSYQALSPKQHKDILSGDETRMKKVAQELLKRTFDMPSNNTTPEQVHAVIQCLIDNGVDKQEADIVAEALYFIMKGESIEKYIANVSGNI